MLKVPFLANEVIESKADHFRKEYFGTHLPVDPEEIWDCVLKHEIRFYKSLKRLTGIEAAVTRNFTVMLIDEGSYRQKKQNPGRLAFSIAHELGHFNLHKECLSQLQIESVELWKFWLQAIDEQSYFRLELQADKFAANLMMPRKEVIIAAQQLANFLANQSPIKPDIHDDSFRRYFATILSKEFNVSVQAMEYRLIELGYWI